MNRTITIKGTGKVRVKPDVTIVTLHLESLAPEYNKAIKKATKAVAEIESAIERVGFQSEDLKTTYFNIRMKYENVLDENNKYINTFIGYVCEQDLKLEFALNSELLSRVINAIANTNTEPNLNISFSVKDKTAINDLILLNATHNAKHKAEILAHASQVRLGELVSIEYNFDDVHFRSNTTYGVDHALMMKGMLQTPNINPEEITITDTVTFVWWIV